VLEGGWGSGDVGEVCDVGEVGDVGDAGDVVEESGSSTLVGVEAEERHDSILACC
jgi:hypothetical protein